VASGIPGVSVPLPAVQPFVWHHHLVGPGRYSTPEDAALSGWGPSARAHVVSSTMEGSIARIIIDTEPSHPMEVVCVRGQDGLWDWVSDSTA